MPRRRQPLKRHPDGLLALRESALRGCCTLCGDELPEGKRVLCNRGKCRKAYQQLYQRDWKLTHPDYQSGYRKL